MAFFLLVSEMPKDGGLKSNRAPAARFWSCVVVMCGGLNARLQPPGLLLAVWRKADRRRRRPAIAIPDLGSKKNSHF